MFGLLPKQMEDSKTVRNVIPFLEIQDNTVITETDGILYAVVGVKVGSINMDLLSTDEQDAIFKRFENFLESMDTDLQICVVNEPVSLRNYLDYQLENYYNIVHSQKKRLMAAYIHYVAQIAQESQTSRKERYLFVREEIPDRGSYREAIRDVNTKLEAVIRELSNLTQSETFEIKKLMNLDLVKLFQTLCNHEESYVFELEDDMIERRKGRDS